MPKPKIYVTRELPERGLKIIKEYFDAEVWTEYAPPPKKVIIEKAKNVEFVTLYRVLHDGRSTPDTADLKPLPGGYLLRAPLPDGRVVALLPRSEPVTR